MHQQAAGTPLQCSPCRSTSTHTFTYRVAEADTQTSTKKVTQHTSSTNTRSCYGTQPSRERPMPCTPRTQCGSYPVEIVSCQPLSLPRSCLECLICQERCTAADIRCCHLHRLGGVAAHPTAFNTSTICALLVPTPLCTAHQARSCRHQYLKIALCLYIICAFTHLDPTAASSASSDMKGVLPLSSAAASSADAVAGPTPFSTTRAFRADCTAAGLGLDCLLFSSMLKAWVDASTTSVSCSQV